MLRGSLVSLTLLIALAGLVELGFRIATERVMVNDHLEADDGLGYRNLQTAVQCWDERGQYEFRTNELGFRGPELPTGPPPAGTERVLLLGDSFVHGWRVREEDWMGTAVREGLAEAGRRAEVYSVCTQDWGTAQELLALRRYGERVQPDTVVLVVYHANDLLNNEITLAGRSTISPGDYFRPYLVPDDDGDLERRHALPMRALLRHSVVYRLLERRANAGRSPEEMRMRLAADPYTSLELRLKNGDIPERHFEIFREPEPGDPWDSAWRTTEALFLAARAEAERLGAELQVAVIPHMVQVVETSFSKNYDTRLAALGREPLAELLDMNLPERRLEEFFHREGIAHVQMLDAFRRLARETRSPIFINDGHINGAAHTALGRAVAARMAPGAPDLCAHGADGPVDVLSMYGEPPFELDLEREEHWPFFGFGWVRWIPPGAPFKYHGWVLDAGGNFAVRSGFYTLQGLLTPECKFPVTLSVSQLGGRKTSFVRKSFDEPGPFVLEFDAREAPFVPGDPWVVLRLNAEGVPPSAGPMAPPGLVLHHVRVAPESPATFVKSRGIRKRGNTLRHVWLRVLDALVRLPPRLIQHLAWGAPTRAF